DWSKCLGGDAQAAADICKAPRIETGTCMTMAKLADRDACLEKIRAQRRCKPEKNPGRGTAGGAFAVGSSQQDACAQLLRNDKGEYSAGKCICSETSGGLWRCTLGD